MGVWQQTCQQPASKALAERWQRARRSHRQPFPNSLDQYAGKNFLCCSTKLGAIVESYSGLVLRLADAPPHRLRWLPSTWEARPTCGSMGILVPVRPAARKGLKLRHLWSRWSFWTLQKSISTTIFSRHWNLQGASLYCPSIATVLKP